MANYPLVKIGDVCRIEKGQTGIQSAIPGDYPLVTTGLERKNADTYQFDTAAVCIPLVSSTGHGKKTLNYVHFQDGKFALGTILAAVIPNDPKQLNAAYLHQYLQFYKDTKIVPWMKGAANVSLAIRDIAQIEVPLPPIEQQNKFIGIFNRATIFSEQLLQEFERQSTYLTQLRQTILQEAIEGKLTAGWRSQHPVQTGDPETDAAALLAQIQAEKARLVAQKQLRPEQPLPPIREEEMPFPLPAGWVWCRLGKCSINRDEARQPISQSERQGREKTFPYYGASGIIDSIDGYTHEGKNLLIGEDGANLVSRTTPIAFVADGRYWVNNHAHVIGFVNMTTLSFVEIYINAINLTPYITGGFQPKLNQQNLNQIIISFPPLAEQRAIVERVERLLALVDGLAAQVAERKAQADALMQAVLREAFAG